MNFWNNRYILWTLVIYTLLKRLFKTMILWGYSHKRAWEYVFHLSNPSKNKTGNSGAKNWKIAVEIHKNHIFEM